ncbi:MAG: hypothetical protein G01um101466_406, partial [Parcubacteria group bacterium Gr01-1014_66]
SLNHKSLFLKFEHVHIDNEWVIINDADTQLIYIIHDVGIITSDLSRCQSLASYIHSRNGIYFLKISASHYVLRSKKGTDRATPSLY